MDEIRALVVDDDKDFLQLMVSHLKRRGFVVERAYDGVEAHEILTSADPFAVLVADLTMPRMGGLELLHKARAFDPMLEVIVITAAGTLESAIESMREDGAYDFLLKPLESINELSAAVSRAAEHRSLRLEREALHARLRQEADRLQALIASTADAILSADGDGKLQIVNPAARILIGQKDLIGSDALTNLPQPLAVAVANWQANGENQPAVVELPWPAGSTQMISLAPIPGDDDGAAGWVMAVRDVTHLKRLDDLKLQMLTEAVGKIRLPLAQGFSTLAELNELVRGSDNRPAQLVYRLVKVLGQFQVWADDVISMAQIEAGIGVQVTEVDLSDLVRSWVPALSDELVKERGLEIDLAIDDHVPLILADKDLLHRLLQRLVVQAARRAGNGVGLQIAIRYRDDKVWIEVRDAGFTQERGGLAYETAVVHDGNGSSTGLELAMVKAIVNRIGGQVWIRNEGQVGMDLAICLPASSARM